MIGESIQGTALVYDSEGNLINKEDAESVSGLYDWENCPMIQQIEDETAIPSTFTVIPVKKKRDTISNPRSDVLPVKRL